MPARLKRLHNRPEQVVHQRLQTVCSQNDAHVYPKIRTADVLSIDNAGLSDTEYRYTLQSHFDFVAFDHSLWPLFAVEFDGPSHAGHKQRLRDAIKNRLCAAFELPLLRINANYITRQYRNRDLLTWIVDVWFLQRAFDDAQDRGLIPQEEGFASRFLSVEGSDESWPWWLSLPVYEEIERLHKAGDVLDDRPFSAVARAADGTLHGIAWLELTSQTAIYATTAMRRQLFPIEEGDTVEQLAEFELYEVLQRVRSGRTPSLPTHQVDAAIRQFRYKHEPFQSSVHGNMGGLMQRQYAAFGGLTPAST
jgi:hypothetical protein